MKQRAEQFFTSRRVRDRAAILTLVGTLLLVSPIAGIFQIDAKIGGIPVTLLYLFAVWALLIAVTALLSRQMTDDATPGEMPPDGRADRQRNADTPP
ncbi:MAG: hypothetical protein AAGD13_15090 [Pseudomonadota bacterium]